MTLVQIGKLTLNVDRLVGVLDADDLGLRLLTDDGRELAILEQQDAQALRVWLESHGSRLA
jgi:hypothetical protein